MRIGLGELRHITGFDQLQAAALLVLAIARKVLGIGLDDYLDGRGVLLRSMWDVKPLLEQGKLVQVLHDYTQSANVWAVYPTRLTYSGKLRACVEFLQEYFKGLSI